MSGITADVAYLTRALKMPRARQIASLLADTARDEGWNYTEFLAKVVFDRMAMAVRDGGTYAPTVSTYVVAPIPSLVSRGA